MVTSNADTITSRIGGTKPCSGILLNTRRIAMKMSVEDAARLAILDIYNISFLTDTLTVLGSCAV